MVTIRQATPQVSFAEVAESYQYQPWSITENSLDPAQLSQRETVFTIGNGYLGTRGNFEEGYGTDLPMTLIHGVYDDVPLAYTELANCPDWLSLAFLIDGERFTLDAGSVLSYERTLNVRNGVLTRAVTWRSPQGKELTFRFERFASLADPHQLSVRCEVTPLNFSGPIEVRASLNGYPANKGYNHWAILDQGQQGERVWLHTTTRHTQIEVAMAAQLNVWGLDADSSATIESLVLPGYPTWAARYQGQPNATVTFEKQVVVFTSHEQVDPLATVLAHRVDDYHQSKRAHLQAWETLWEQCDVLIEGDVRAQFALRYNLFQVLISASTQDERVSIPAKTLSGVGYKGHIFWDTELFILPFLVHTQPKIARNLLTYRYHTLAGARRKAQHYGYEGAMFAWESAASGDEVTPRWVVPKDPYGQDVRIWCRDRAIHITADIAYASWQYWLATGDDDWMVRYGAEMILGGAQFWSSRVTRNADHYELCEVVGPDEYHEQVDNNAYTNRMVQWHLEKALELHNWLQHHHPQTLAQLAQHIPLGQVQLDRWQDIVDHISIPMQGEIVEQCDGFLGLGDIDLNSYEPRTESMQKILGIEQANQRQVLKQPDVLMLMYLMRAGQEFPYGHLEQNWHYYAPRTDITYGSSLGPAIHAMLAADLNFAAEAYDRFMQAVLVDLEDVRGNAHEGIHAASAGSVWQTVVLGFGGVQFTDHGPVANPHLPEGWTRLKFKIQWRGQWYHFDLRPVDPAESASSHPVAYVPLGCPTADLRGVIFDLDGVITDTAEFHYQAWQQLADELGVPFDRQMNESLRGVSRRDSLLKILGDRTYPEPELAAMMTRKNDHYQQLIKQINAAHVLPGVIDLLDQLQEAGIKIALGSASKNARAVLERLGLADRFAAIADGHSVARSKPAPDLFIYAARQLGLDPQQCIVVEDAAAGVDAAIAGSMWSIGIGPAERVGKADLVLPNLANAQWPQLVQQLKQSVGA